ncbi:MULTISPECIES: nitroreductase family protein [Muribaculaceae]|mgnify:FL=1|jgi:nitroreductase|uniref:NAD(P)H nitroreductase n=2 Tax=Muribaculum intestinale TaxID=1796646 RepID=A0A1B1SDA4_9BACT|nr:MULTISPECIES: nitroreductase family protein [Muribaculaceae]ROT05326.1 NAD(P)H nitroreductase [Muribaculaceae bacterium Isolate-100 (HZI)]RXE64614.1 NAD(P)H nitroreductase [Muribaculaceae bacterium Isolate-007 (NCI)]ANU64818.1 NAD(P)H nitroreductase [Muribaculum intestinale]ASB39106.1 NAD(P)H nitroreductase [Muribaculum intestinale]MYM12135.1 NAD(P)H nitroreductase [Muribaculum intestinale]
MTSFHDLITNRRSIRRYTDEEISAEDVKTIMEAALMAPTSKSSRPWQFVIVEDAARLEALSKCKEAGAMPIAKAPLAIVVAVDVEASDPWIEDAAIAATFIQLQAQDLGLGSCWIQIRGRYTDRDLESETYVQNVLDMPDTILPVAIITIGHPAEEKKPQNLEKLLWEKVHINEWKER